MKIGESQVTRLGVHPQRRGDIDGVRVAAPGSVPRLGFLRYQREHPATPAGPVQWLTRSSDGIHEGFVAGVRPGDLYCFTRDGETSCPILDPYARAMTGLDPRGSGPMQPRCVVVDPSFDWAGDTRPQTPWESTVLYELHVRGWTQQLSGVPSHLRGTYAGLGHPAACAYLKNLGITAVELMPVTQMIDEVGLRQRGKTNDWGYNPLACFAPAARYAALRTPGAQVGEFKHMVRSLHRAGIEVIVDLVLNHTGEHDLPPGWGAMGALTPNFYCAPHGATGVQTTGCGNTVNLDHPVALRWAMDCLRYWVSELHVDGFRFDLAPTMCRENGVFNPKSAFIKCIYQDPIVSQVKLIAEPWDLGPGGYQAGNFPQPWREWNDRFREDVRRYWRGERGWTGAVATRLAGSSDRFRGRGPLASINYITSHDGMTLTDLVSYARKHNLANGENNSDGSGCDFSANYGHEGPTDDPQIHELRQRQAKNLIATLLLAQGVPMVLAGDELGRTQAGNNNAYCHDSPLTWVDWQGADDDRRAFVQACISLRRRSRLLHRHQFLTGGRDVRWLDSTGQDLVGEMWEQTEVLGMWLEGEGAGAEILVVCLNPSPKAVCFAWLSHLPGEGWALALATQRGRSLAAVTEAGMVAAHSLVVLTRGCLDAS